MFATWRRRSVTNWTPANYAVNETDTIITVHAGEVVMSPVWCYIRTAFDGTSPAASLGDDGDVDRFITTTNADVANTGYKLGTGGSGSVFTAIGAHLYTAANTVDVVLTAATGSPTAGAADWWITYTKISPP